MLHVPLPAEEAWNKSQGRKCSHSYQGTEEIKGATYTMIPLIFILALPIIPHLFLGRMVPF